MLLPIHHFSREFHFSISFGSQQPPPWPSYDCFPFLQCSSIFLFPFSTLPLSSSLISLVSSMKDEKNGGDLFIIKRCKRTLRVVFRYDWYVQLGQMYVDIMTLEIFPSCYRTPKASFSLWTMIEAKRLEKNIKPVTVTNSPVASAPAFEDARTADSSHWKSNLFPSFLLLFLSLFLFTFFFLFSSLANSRSSFLIVRPHFWYFPTTQFRTIRAKTYKEDNGPRGPRFTSYLSSWKSHWPRFFNLFHKFFFLKLKNARYGALLNIFSTFIDFDLEQATNQLFY